MSNESATGRATGARDATGEGGATGADERPIDAPLPGRIDPVAAAAELAVLQPSALARPQVEHALTVVASLHGWLDGLQTGLVARLGELRVPDVDAIVAGRCRADRSVARRAVRRARTIAQVPALGELLRAGQAGGEHVDAFGAALRSAPDQVRQQLLDQGPDLVQAAASMSPEQFRAHLHEHVRRASADGGMDELERHKRQVGLRVWNDRDTRMVRLSGAFDAEAGLWLWGRLTSRTEALFHGPPIPRCPTDPDAKQAFLMAHALLQLLGVPPDTPAPFDPTAPDFGLPPNSPAPAPRPRADVVIVIDQRTFHEGPHDQTLFDPGGPAGFDLPVEVGCRIARSVGARLHTAVVDEHGVVVAVDGRGDWLDLGRTRRFPNRAQRFALRTMYAGCDVPACEAPIAWCDPHHVHEWEQGGSTDLADLLPLCRRHHRIVHRDGWRITLTPERVVTYHLPDGTVMTTGPPRTKPPSPAVA